VLTEEVGGHGAGAAAVDVRELYQAEKWLARRPLAEGGRLPPHGSVPARPQGRIAGFGRIGKAIARRIEAFGLV